MRNTVLRLPGTRDRKEKSTVPPLRPDLVTSSPLPHIARLRCAGDGEAVAHRDVRWGGGEQELPFSFAMEKKGVTLSRVR